MQRGEDSLATMLKKVEAVENFEKMLKDPAFAFERRRAAMLIVMIESVAYKNVGFEKEQGPGDYLVEKGFTLVEIKDLLPSCRILMTQLYLDHPEIFRAIADAKKRKEQGDGPIHSQ